MRSPQSLLLPMMIQNHEAHCLCAVTTCVYRDPVTAHIVLTR